MSLPNVFQNKNININENDQDFFYGNKLNETNKTIDVSKKIKSIFNSDRFIYKINVNIVTSNDNFNTTIIGKINNDLITIDNKKIPINEIIDINEL